MTFAADPGTGPLFTICGWLAAGLRSFYSADSDFLVRTTPGALQNIHLVGQKQLQVGATIPPLNVYLAREGRGAFSDAYEHLRAIGTLPHRTLFTFVVADSIGAPSLHEIRRSRYPVKLATRLVDHGSIGFVADEILRHYELQPELLAAFGGEVVAAGPGYGAIEHLMRGEADAALNQAGSALWAELAEARDVRFLSLDEALVRKLESKHQCTRTWIRKDDFRGVDGDVLCLEWSDIIVFTSEELPYDIAYNLARVMVETSATLEEFLYTPGEKYSHLTSRIDPEKVCCGTMVPLHPGAEEWFREQGYIR